MRANSASKKPHPQIELMLSSSARGRMMIAFSIAIGLSVYLAGAPAARALQPADVPANLPETQRASLLQTKARLEKERDDLLARIETHNAGCPKDLPEDSPKLAPCQREQQQLNSDQAGYLAKVKQFNTEVARAATRPSEGAAPVDPNIARLEKQIASDEEAIRRLGLKKRAADFEEWSNLTEQARNQFISETLRILARLAIDEASIGLKSQTSTLSSSLTPKKAEDIILRLEQNGATNPDLATAIRALSRATTVKERTDAANKIIGATTAAIKQLAGTSSPDKTKAVVEGFCETAADIGSKKLGLVGWQTRALVSGAELTAELGFAFGEQHIAESTIQQLDHMTEEQLKSVQKLSEVMRKHVAELKAAKQRH
jgi:hypothetical protein